MTDYIIRRLLLTIPTLLGILVINFLIVQTAPGGPVERTLALWQLHGLGDSSGSLAGNTGTEVLAQQSNRASGQNLGYPGTRGVDPELIAELQKLYGFDKPMLERFFDMLVNYARFDFGTSFYRDISVIDLILEKIPVSLSLGLWSTLIIYLLSIPMGIRKAVQDGSAFDRVTTLAIIIGYAIPGFLLALALIVLFAGGSYLQWFPLRGLSSPAAANWPFWRQVIDYFWHLSLPLTALTIGGFATLTLLTKNSFLDEISKQYVITARAMGLSEKRVLYGHVFRNAMLIIIAGMPATLVGLFFTGSLLIEVIFSLDGLGLLGYESIVKRDYPVIFATVYIFTFLGLILKLISDISFTLIDPRIHFHSQ